MRARRHFQEIQAYFSGFRIQMAGPAKIPLAEPPSLSMKAECLIDRIAEEKNRTQCIVIRELKLYRKWLINHSDIVLQNPTVFTYFSKDVSVARKVDSYPVFSPSWPIWLQHLDISSDIAWSRQIWVSGIVEPSINLHFVIFNIFNNVNEQQIYILSGTWRLEIVPLKSTSFDKRPLASEICNQRGLLSSVMLEEMELVSSSVMVVLLCVGWTKCKVHQYFFIPWIQTPFQNFKSCVAPKGGNMWRLGTFYRWTLKAHNFFGTWNQNSVSTMRPWSPTTVECKWSRMFDRNKALKNPART